MGTKGCSTRSRAEPLPKSTFLRQDWAIPSLARCQPRTAPATLGWPPRRSSSRAGRRGPPSGARGLPKPTDTNAQALGQRRKQQHSSCPCCSSQRALGLQWCQGGVNSAAGTGWSHPGRCKGTVLAVLSLRLCNDLSEVSALPYGQ